MNKLEKQLGETPMTQAKILEKYEALPESLKTEVGHYIEFLLEKYVNPTGGTRPNGKDENQHENQDENQQDLEKSHGYGSWAGQIIMSDDFDEPLEDLKEYM
jgi:hypothetical protein